jgi:dipeptidyl aminopeptidase/acylaminoacyl peptidase
MFVRRIVILWLGLWGGLVACSQPLPPVVTPLVSPVAVAVLPTVTETAAATPTLSFTPTPTAEVRVAAATVTPSPNPTQTPSATPDLYSPYTIEALAARTYGGGEIEIVDIIEEDEIHKQYVFTYPSDGLTIYGYMSVPTEGDSFPVAIVAHGYIPPEEYEIIAYTRRYVDALVEAGYFVFHPNLQNFPPSDNADNPFRVGYAVDLLNLIAIIKEQSQDPHGILRRAQGDYIHLMGHSMGGGAALRAVTIWPEAVRAVVLYGSMSGDEALNYQQIQQWTNGRSGSFELNAPPEMLAAISPSFHLDRLQVPVSIHHSLVDQTVPYAWSEQLCADLQAINHPVECFMYEGVPHTFRGYADTLFMERMIDFFRRY